MKKELIEFTSFEDLSVVTSECISFFGKESKRKTSYLTSWTKEDEDDVDNMKPVYEKIPLLVVTEFELEMEHG